MKKLLLPVLFALTLTACGNSTAITMNATFSTNGKDDKAALILATKKIITRRLAMHNADLVDFSVKYNDDNSADITIKGSDAEATNALLDEMTQGVNLEIRKQVSDHQEGDITVEKLGDFRATGIDGDDVSWVLSRASENALNQGEVMIQFTEEGSQKMNTFFNENVGKNIGLFVRGKLAANFAIPDGGFQESIIIPGIPSVEMAEIFADDMNVGTNMTFTQSQ